MIKRLCLFRCIFAKVKSNRNVYPDEFIGGPVWEKIYARSAIFFIRDSAKQIPMTPRAAFSR